MNEVLDQGPTFEQYDDDLIMNLVGQGWEMDADGLDEDEAIQMMQEMNNECRVFQKEDGSCTILVKQMGALEEMSNEYGQTPKGVQDNMHNEYYDRLPEVMGKNNQNR